jgi:hypothetical protein
VLSKSKKEKSLQIQINTDSNIEENEALADQVRSTVESVLDASHGVIRGEV